MKMSEVWYEKINELNEMILECEIGKDGRIIQLQKKKAKMCVAFMNCLEAER